MNANNTNNSIEYYQAQFILKAIKDGWTVNMDEQGNFCFVKDRNSVQRASDNDYSRKFLETYGNANIK